MGPWPRASPPGSANRIGSGQISSDRVSIYSYSKKTRRGNVNMLTAIVDTDLVKYLPTPYILTWQTTSHRVHRPTPSPSSIYNCQFPYSFAVINTVLVGRDRETRLGWRKMTIALKNFGFWRNTDEMKKSHSCCLHPLLPPERNTEVLSKLRYATKYPIPHSRTKRYQYFLNYSLTHYQK